MFTQIERPLGCSLGSAKALCGTTLYASVPKEGVDDKLIKEWETNKAGLFRRDNNEFPHELFDPAWRLRLETVAETLAGYFRHEEPKSVGETGELKRRVIVSLDKHFIGKETNPLDDDNEDAQDDKPIVTSNDLVLRSGDRNLQPLVDAGIENKYMSKLRHGKRLTFAEMNIIKSRTKLMEDETLVSRGAIEDGYIDGYISDPEWAGRLKTWRQLTKVGRFADVAEQAGIPVQDVEDAARYGNYDDKCGDTDWNSIQAAIDVLTGRTKRQTKLKRAKQKAGE